MDANELESIKIKEKAKITNNIIKQIGRIAICILTGAFVLNKLKIENNQPNYNNNFESKENTSNTSIEEELSKNERKTENLISQNINFGIDLILKNINNITNSKIKIWEKFGDKWKLKLENDSYACDQWISINDKWYLFGKDEYMLIEWQEINKKWYYLDPKNGDMKIGWQLINEKYYYFELSGEMVTGWKWVTDKCYYFDSTGAMMTNATTPDGYKVNEKGEWVQ